MNMPQWLSFLSLYIKDVMDSITFLIQCQDQQGLVAKISTFFYQQGLNIIDCQEHVDTTEKQYFMRLKLDGKQMSSTRKTLAAGFTQLAEQLELTWSVHYSDERQKVAILVTKTSHCLYDLLVRHEQNELNCEVSLIISNHPHLESVAQKFRIPFYCCAVKTFADPQQQQVERARQEQEVAALLDKHHIDLTILARYMLILSAEFTQKRKGKVINVHHAILPAFKGANPYRRAWDRGVKMIGATSHYATADLDEGPIIDQDVERVTHESSAKDLIRIGADIERIVLARAVKAHLESRIIVQGNKTILFS
ncbi:MAG: formyltetrahydrofolate deformylase [Alteromonadaceae bacterium]|jgi:formyltetrahydrofolate deformylase